MFITFIWNVCSIQWMSALQSTINCHIYLSIWSNSSNGWIDRIAIVFTFINKIWYWNVKSELNLNGLLKFLFYVNMHNFFPHSNCLFSVFVLSFSFQGKVSWFQVSFVIYFKYKTCLIFILVLGYCLFICSGRFLYLNRSNAMYNNFIFFFFLIYFHWFCLCISIFVNSYFLFFYLWN